MDVTITQAVTQAQIATVRTPDGFPEELKPVVVFMELDLSPVSA